MIRTWKSRRKKKKNLRKSKSEESCLRLIIGRTASLTLSGLGRKSLRRRDNLVEWLTSNKTRLQSSLRIFSLSLNAKKVLLRSGNVTRQRVLNTTVNGKKSRSVRLG